MSTDKPDTEQSSGIDAGDTTPAPDAKAPPTPNAGPAEDAGSAADPSPSADASADTTASLTGETSQQAPRFQDAVRDAIRDALDPDGEHTLYEASAGKTDASTMVAQVLQALTRKTNREQGDDVHSADHQGAEVIDLDAVRRSRQTPPPSALGQLVGAAIKDTFQQFMTAYADGKQLEGKVEIDAQFLKDNGPKFLGTLFHGLAGAFQTALDDPEEAQAASGSGDEVADAKGQEAPAAGADDEAPAGVDEAPAKTDDEPRPVNVNVDLGSLLLALFRR